MELAGWIGGWNLGHAGNAITGARYLAEAIKAVGIGHVFFIDAVLRKTLLELEQVGVARVLAHSEKSVAYMADGYARISGRAAVCMAQSVGAANLAAALQDAYLHRSPVVALTGRKPPLYRHRNAYQELDHAPLFAPVTKFHAEVEVGDELPILFAQALREATTGTPRPAHLDINGLLGELIEDAVLSAPELPVASLGDPARARPAPDPREIEAAARALALSRRPVIVVGTGGMQSGAQAAVRALAERCAIPIASSLGGRGIVPTTHPLYVGVVGTYSAPPANRIVHEADLVVYVGCHTGDQVTNNWTVPRPGTPIVQIDIDGAEIGRNYAGVIGVLGDPRRAVEALVEAIDGRRGGTDWSEAAAGQVRRWRAEMEPHLRSGARAIRVERLCHEITQALPEDGVLVSDTGYSGIWTGTLIDLPHATQTYLRAAGSLGWAFPASLGAKCGAGDRPVVCFTGDGGFYYHLSELETARRRGLAVVTVVNNNSAFAQGIVKVRKLYEPSGGNADETITFGPTDFAAVARAFGVEGIRVESPDEIAPALRRALSHGGPVVVDVVTDPLVRAPEPWSPPA
ncbi:MAG: thiamine pyrophosphate-binding protein [Hyphomicrobiaceae bacterium]